MNSGTRTYTKACEFQHWHSPIHSELSSELWHNNLHKERWIPTLVFTHSHRTGIGTLAYELAQRHVNSTTGIHLFTQNWHVNSGTRICTKTCEFQHWHSPIKTEPASELWYKNLQKDIWIPLAQDLAQRHLNSSIDISQFTQNQQMNLHSDIWILALTKAPSHNKDFQVKTLARMSL